MDSAGAWERVEEGPLPVGTPLPGVSELLESVRLTLHALATCKPSLVGVGVNHLAGLLECLVLALERRQATAEGEAWREGWEAGRAPLEGAAGSFGSGL
jgi:hypothetical protein